ncbi:MAG: cytochrome c biogenesis protein CcdA [Armatimonadetes bacterium]|nr:cytochrome c biogenesis protein CcdA [Armatimonadota bacterium]
MDSGLTDTIADAMANGGPWLLPLAFAGGLCTSLNPCAYPMMGAVAGYVWAHGQRSVWRSLAIAAAFLGGLALTYTVLGVVGGLVGPLLGLSRAGWAYAVGGVCIAAGLLMTDILPLEFPGFSLLTRYWQRLKGVPGALALGVLLGLVATPCATPPLAVIVSVAAVQRAVAMAGVLLFVYALGHGLPAIVIGLLAGGLGGLERFAPYGRALQIVGGWLIIAVGLYLILKA